MPFDCFAVPPEPDEGLRANGVSVDIEDAVRAELVEAHEAHNEAEFITPDRDGLISSIGWLKNRQLAGWAGDHEWPSERGSQYPWRLRCSTVHALL